MEKEKEGVAFSFSFFSPQSPREELAKKKKKKIFISSFGGGSPHDAAKGIAIVASNGGDIRDYEGVDKMTAAMTPLVAVRKWKREIFRFFFLSSTFFVVLNLSQLSTSLINLSQPLIRSTPPPAPPPR